MQTKLLWIGGSLRDWAASLGRLDGAEGVVLRGHALLREQVEERTLADVGQPDQA